MIKTTYQTPELRDANDNVVQEGSFGKNTALANSTNDGWIDYVMNDLEALHDTIGDSAPTLDGNGHVVEPANLAIGDEDGLRIKNNYLKLSGGNVTGITSFRTDLRMLDNQDNRFGGLYVPASSSTQQYMQFYSGTRATGDARLTLYPSGDGHFQLLAYSNDGSNSYALQSDNAGNLNWRGYPLAWKKDYLPLSGGVLNGYLQFSGLDSRIISSRADRDGAVSIYGGAGYSTGAYAVFYGINHASNAGRFIIRAVADGSTYKELQGRPDGTLTWGGKNIERVESSGTNYIRYANGLQICWGRIANVTTSATTVTFPVAFTDANYSIAFGNSINAIPKFGNILSTSFNVSMTTGTDNVRYVAIGRWA